MRAGAVVRARYGSGNGDCVDGFDLAKALAGRYRTIMLPRLSNVLMVWLGKLARRMIKHRLAGLLQA